MNLKTNTITTMLTAAAIAGGAYFAGNGVSNLSEQNNVLRTEIVDKDHKIDSLKNDIVELKRQKAEIEFKNELDSINKYDKNLGTDFYERIINNAAFLDNYNYPYTRMIQIIDKIPNEEYWNLHDISQNRWEASENLRKFFTACPKYLED